MSAQKSTPKKTIHKRALGSKFPLLSAQKSAQTSRFAQKSAQLRSFTQKRAHLSAPLKKSAKEGNSPKNKKPIPWKDISIDILSPILAQILNIASKNKDHVHHHKKQCVAETSEIFVSREFSRIFFHFHFLFLNSSCFNFTFTSRKRLKGFYFSLFSKKVKAIRYSGTT